MNWTVVGQLSWQYLRATTLDRCSLSHGSSSSVYRQFCPAGQLATADNSDNNSFSACGFVLVGFKKSNNNNKQDNVYGSIIIAIVIARVHPVHLMNVDWAPGGRQPLDQANRLGLWVRRKLSATIHIHHRRSYYYSARKLIVILLSHREWKAESA